jgi:ubiquinone biosynthesis protein
VSGLPRARHAVHVAVRLAQLVAARFAERVVPSLRLVSLEEAVATFCDAVEHQIHLLNEAAHNRRFRANFQDEPDLHFPLLFEDACSDEVLTMEFVEGLREEELEASSVDVRHVVMAGMRFEHNGRIVLFDLGLVGKLSDKDRLTNAQLLFSFATGDGKTVARSFYENSPHTATPDYDAYEREICAFALRLRLLGLGNVQLALEIGRIFDILRRHPSRRDRT